MNPSGPRVLVTVGTDKHPFTRLVGWADDLMSSGRIGSCLVQHGTASAPLLCEGEAFLEYDRLLEEMGRADVIVTHGGPATITEARSLGLQPICVPRDPTLGEHVDQHQQLFARRLDAAGIVVVCEDERAFADAVVEQADRPPRSAGGFEQQPPGMVRFATAVDKAAHRSRRRR